MGAGGWKRGREHRNADESASWWGWWTAGMRGGRHTELRAIPSTVARMEELR